MYIISEFISFGIDIIQLRNRNNNMTLINNKEGELMVTKKSKKKAMILRKIRKWNN